MKPTGPEVSAAAERSTDPAAQSRPVVTARLARVGFADPAEAARLLTGASLKLWDESTNSAADDSSAVLVSALGRTADPGDALAALAELVGTGPGPRILDELRHSAVFRGRLLGVLGSSKALTEHVLQHPHDALLLTDSGPEERFDLPVAAQRIADVVGADLGDPIRGSRGRAAERHDSSAESRLREAYRRELLLIAARDLAGELSMADVGQALADLAGFMLRTALAVARGRLRGRVPEFALAVIAMGKTGGRELNYVSDVDVIFVAEPITRPDADADASGSGNGGGNGNAGNVGGNGNAGNGGGNAGGRTSAGDGAALSAATRLASEMMRICRTAAWEVDAALRPEGKQGALVRTVASHQAYYQRWASTWEFQALLKARPIAGDADLGQAYLAAIEPMIWAAAERPDFVADVRAMRRRVVSHLSSDIAGRELKLGSGGLRDVEFAVQLLQLVHGRAEPRLRVRSTLGALGVLRDGGYVGRDDAISLIDAYVFLRSTEHRLQLYRLRRTHLVPEETPQLHRLARSLGFRPDNRGNAVAVWRSEWALHVREVRRLHEKLFYRPLLEAVAKVPSDGLRLSTGEARRRISALGFDDPDGALRHIEALTTGVSRRAAIQRTLLPVILSDLADAPDPDGGLLAYRQVSDALGSTPWYLRLLRDEGGVSSRLSAVLGTSRYVANLLVRTPEALQMLGDDAQLVPHRRAEVEVAMSTAARRQPDVAAAAHTIRSLRRAELIRIAFADLLGMLSTSEVQIALTAVADSTIAAALSVARRTVVAELAERGEDVELEFAVIAMGRLGGQELGYGSDADILFVYDLAQQPGGPDPGAALGPGRPGRPEAANRQARAIAERLRAMLSTTSSDPPLVLDANLRPEGRDGPLVRSLTSYAEYYARWASVWERQALLRARFAAGSPELGERFIDLIEDLRYPPEGLSPTDVLEIRRIKGRIDSERVPRGSDPLTNTKLGRGGLGDVEWTAQLLQLHHACRVPGLRTTSTLTALTAAAQADLMSADEAAALEAAWLRASAVRSAIVLATDKPGDQLPKPGRTLSAVGRILGYRSDFDPGQLLDDYLRATRRARRVVEAVFYDSEF